MEGRSSARRRDEAGLTMLELILVMVIICTVLAMAAPSLKGFFASRRTTDAAAQLVALTKFARSRAVAEGRTYRLNLDTDTGRYWLSSQEGGAFVSSGSTLERVFSLPEGTVASWREPEMTAPAGWISFYPDGRTEAAVIRLTGIQKETVDVVCRSPAEQFEVVGRGEGRV